MKGFDFPIFKTKAEGHHERFSLEDPVERRRYFEFKAGDEIERLRDWLRENTFVGFLLGKKNSGKGTYIKLFMEAVGSERVAHISVGDIVREVYQDLADEGKKEELFEFLRSHYRGFISLEKALDALLGRDTKTLLPTEFILALVERAIDKIGRRAIFIDGFPRDLDQVSYSLYFRALIGYRDDPDFLVFIDVPQTVIHERMKYRVVCSLCNTPRNTKLLTTKEVQYDADKNEFFLICDNPSCEGRRMIAKEGDELGIDGIRGRIEADESVMQTLLTLEGVPKVFLRNTVPVARAGEYVDDYETTPAYRYEFDETRQKVRVIEEPWIVPDDQKVPSYSLLPQPIVVALIKQTAKILGL